MGVAQEVLKEGLIKLVAQEVQIFKLINNSYCYLVILVL